MKNCTPPKPLLRFFRWFCHPDLHPFVEGDLLELYEEILKNSGKKNADLRFVVDVLLLFRPDIIKSFKTTYHSNTTALFRHNFLLTYRNFKRYKSSFFINLIGLSAGLASALLIYLWVYDEMSFDNFHDKDSQLFQVMHNVPTADGILTIEGTQGLLASALLEEMPEVEYAVPVINYGAGRREGVLSVANNNIRAGVQFVGKDFFKVFSYNLVHGDKNQVLSDKYSVVISDELAIKLFNTTENIIGKTVECDYNRFGGSYQISGIFEKPSENSTDQFDFLFSYELFFDVFTSNLENWGNSNPSTYLILKESTNIYQFNAKIKHFINTKLENSSHTLFIRKYSDKYLYDHYENGIQSGGRIDYVRLFSIIALFILVIACINFMNLSTAKASRRLKEIGVKKALGAQRKTLIFQHMGESIAMAFLSLMIAAMLVILFLPQFNAITAKNITLSMDVNLVFTVLAITLFTGLISGCYPSLYLSGFNPIIVLKGKLNTSMGALWTRKGLVIFQFVMSVILIVSVLVVYKQMEFVQSKNLGYSRDNIIQFERMAMSREKLESLLSEIKRISGVVNASTIGGDLTRGDDGGGFGGIDWPGKDPDQRIQFWNRNVDYDLIETLGIELVAGRSFSREFEPEDLTVICNESAIEIMGLEDPIGQTIKVMGIERRIIGIVKNFHFQSLYENMKPLVLRRFPNQIRVIVKIQAGTEKETINQLKDLYEGYVGFSFDYKFMDEEYQKLYVAEQRVSGLSGYFAGIAILISCLGLFGLAAFTAERRVKEIGVRKILGSSEFGIVFLLSGDFTKMVIIAILIALPLSYFIAARWLESFAYRIDLKWWFFVGAGLVALFIAWFTVGMQTIKAARVNPVECLKDE